MSPGRDPCGRLQSFGAPPSLATPLMGFGAHGARATHTSRGYSRRAQLALGLRWPQNSRHHERFTILATIPTEPLFLIVRTVMAINSCTSPRRHISTSHRLGRGPCECVSFGVISPNTSVKSAPFRPAPPLGSLHTSLTSLTSGQKLSGRVRHINLVDHI